MDRDTSLRVETELYDSLDVLRIVIRGLADMLDNGDDSSIPLNGLIQCAELTDRKLKTVLRLLSLA